MNRTARRGQASGQLRHDVERGRALHRILREHREDQVVEIAGDIRVGLADPRQANHRIHPRQQVQRSAERRRTRAQLEREHAERVDVHLRTDDEAGQVLGREVRRGPDDARLAREILVLAPALEREAEVEQLDRTVDDDRVRRLDVAVDHATSVEKCQPLRELGQHAADPREVDDRDRAPEHAGRRHHQRDVGRGGVCLLERHRAARRLIRDRRIEGRLDGHGGPALDVAPRVDPAQVLHGEVAGSVVRDELVQLDEVRVAERGNGAKLPLEPQGGVGVSDAAELDRDVHVEPQVAAEIDHAHPTATELAHDVIPVPDEPPRSTLVHVAGTVSCGPCPTQSTA
jgi:hypothetical protein